MHHAWDIILNLVMILTAALLLGGLFERFKQSAVLGYLAAGVLLGPSVLKLIEDGEFMDSIAELGVTLLLFSIGLEFSLKRLKSMGAIAAGGGSLQVAATALVVALIGMLAGLNFAAAAVLGLVVAQSSTACVLRLLGDRAELDSIHGRNATGVLLMQDVLLVPTVLAVSSLSTQGDAATMLASVGRALGASVVLVTVLWVVTSKMLPHVFTAALLLRSRELTILLATITALGSAWVTHTVGLSPALGAFIAGIMLAESPFATQVRADIGVLKTLFLTIFFTSVGIMADLGWVRDHVLELLGAVGVLVVVKALVVWGVMLAFRNSHRNAMATGICLAQAGEFSFVLAEMAFRLGGMSNDMFRLIVSAALVTLFLSPFLVSLALPIAGRFEKLCALLRIPQPLQPTLDAVEEHLHNHVIVTGFGPTGQAVARSVQERGNPVVVVEMNPRTVESARQLGMKAFIGDASNEDILEHLHIQSAKAIVITIPDHRAALAVVATALKLAPHTFIVVRARYHRHAPEFIAAGAHVVLDEEVETGAILGDRIVRGMDMRSLARIRKLDIAELADQRPGDDELITRF